MADDNRDFDDELTRLFDLSLDLLCVAGTDGFFKQVNPAFERVLGYSRQELLSRSFLEFVHPEDRTETLEAVERLAHGLAVVDFRNRYRAKDGNYRWLAWRSTPVPERGRIYAVARDITEQKATEEALARKTAELERSNRDLEEFALVASHDLRAPLRAIGNLSQWLEEDLQGELPEPVRQNLAKLRQQVKRMETLMDDLLAYARAGKEHAELERVEVAELIRQVALLLQVPEGFRVEVAGEMPMLETPRAPLELVLRNLIGNAVVHHDRNQGTISLQAKPEGPLWHFRVADDGPGIPADERERVFEMFQRLPSSERTKGSGIGLATVKRIVERYGGTVWLESEGRGSAFHFTWPQRAGGKADG